MPEKKMKEEGYCNAAELTLDESPSDPGSEYEVEVHNVILDREAADIRSWFRIKCNSLHNLDPKY